MTARPATVDELHVFLVGEIARRNRAAADLQRPIIPGREDRAVELLLASVDACGLSITREVPMTGTSATILSRVDAAIAVTRAQTDTTIDTHLFMGLLTDVRAALQATQEAVASVKALEWRLVDDKWWRADSVVGCYDVRQPRISVRARFASDGHFREFDGSVEEAKAAAQVDFDRSIRSALAQPVAQPATTQAEQDVLAERRRQIEVEGWTPAHDDVTHSGGQLAIAGACYAISGGGDNKVRHLLAAKRWTFYEANLPVTVFYWLWSLTIKWSLDWFKPSSRRRDLVKAGALILAEIERLDRAASPATGGA